MKLKFILHGIPDLSKNHLDAYVPGKLPAIRIRQYDLIGKNFEQMEGILWFGSADPDSLNVDAGWRYYILKKL